MDSRLAAILVDPVSHGPLELRVYTRSPDGSVQSGALLNASGAEYPVVHGIPRFVLTEDPGQRQTQNSFGFKWQRREFSEAGNTVSRAWLLDRYGFASDAEMRAYFAERPRVLDAGCGNGFSASLWLNQQWAGPMWVGLDISSAVDVARDRLQGISNLHFVQADVMQVPFAEGSFDLVFSEGVLHHTQSTEQAFKCMAALLRPGGELMAYIYRKKGPIREFTDDYVRDLISGLEPARALAMMAPLTALAKALTDLHVEVDVPEDIPCLGIKAGRQDVQRLIYWHFAKMFWNDAYTFEENNYTNFDWYHPRYAHRHTEEELRRWSAEAGLSVTRLHEAESGYTLRATRD